MDINQKNDGVCTMKVRHFHIENLASDTIHKTETLKLKNPSMFCFGSTASFKVQILRNGEICWTAFMNHRVNKSGCIVLNPLAEIDEFFDKYVNEYEIQITNRQGCACDFYISIWGGV